MSKEQADTGGKPAEWSGADSHDRQPDTRSPPDTRAPESADIRALIAAVAHFAATFETILRQIEPALTLSQIAALELIADRGAVRPFRLASQMGISRQLAWQTCKRLEGLGLAAMQNHGGGRRGVDVTLTDAGAGYLDLVMAIETDIATELGAKNVRATRLHSCRRLFNQMSDLLTARMQPATDTEDAPTTHE